MQHASSLEPEVPTDDGNVDDAVNVFAGSGQRLDADGMPEGHAPAWQRWAARIGLVAVLAAMGIIMFRSLVPGHWWGDDWALYIRQANGLLDRDPGRVSEQNAFTVTQSLGAPFSPPIYPWGYPFVLAIFIPFLGDDVDRLTIISIASALLFAWSWYRLARPRIGTVAALVAMVAVCLTPQLLGWVDLVQSEYVFMAAVGLFLITLDSMVRRGTLLSAQSSWWALAGLGVLAEFAFEIRREGLATVAAIGVAQLVIVVGLHRKLWAMRGRELYEFLERFALPHVSFLVTALTIKAVLPAVLVPRYEGAGIGNVWKYRTKHVLHLADLIGLKRSSSPDPSILGNTLAGKLALAAWGLVLVVGLVLCLTKWRRRNAHLAAYVIVAFVIGCSAKAALSRYFASMAPIASLIVLMTITAGVRYVVARLSPRHPRRRLWIAQIVVLAVVTPMVVANLIDANRRMEYATTARRLDLVQWGAQHPAAQEMFAYVRDHTSPDDVVASFKARSMVLETGRNAIQVDDYRPLNPSIKLALVVQETTSPRALEFEGDPDWTEVWRNERLVIFAPTEAESP